MNWMMQILASLFGWRDIDEDVIAPPRPTVPPVVSVVESPIPPVVPKYLWDTKTNIRHSIRVIADSENLTFIQKELLCDICQCESGFVLRARLENSPKSVDRGLFQWNNYWHPEITDEMAYNPETATKLACRAIKQGKTKAYWSASAKCWNKNGKYNGIISL